MRATCTKIDCWVGYRPAQTRSLKKNPPVLCFSTVSCFITKQLTCTALTVSRRRGCTSPEARDAWTRNRGSRPPAARATTILALPRPSVSSIGSKRGNTILRRTILLSASCADPTTRYDPFQKEAIRLEQLKTRLFRTFVVTSWATRDVLGARSMTYRSAAR